MSDTASKAIEPAAEDTAGTEKKENLEEMFQSLEEVLKGTEVSRVTLDQSFDMYNRGMKILKECSRTIDEVEKKVLVLDEDGETHEF